MNHSKDFLWKNFTKVARFQGFFFFEIAIFREMGSRNLKILKKFLLSSLTCSQNWLIPLADDSKVMRFESQVPTTYYYLPTNFLHNCNL
jgi:hypothetical protein